MRINGFFLFCCACVPGAGQMYLGYMKRGLCLISLFCLDVMACMMLPFLGVFMPVIWMYSFFDSFNLRRQLRTASFPWKNNRPFIILSYPTNPTKHS